MMSYKKKAKLHQSHLYFDTMNEFVEFGISLGKKKKKSVWFYNILYYKWIFNIYSLQRLKINT